MTAELFHALLIVHLILVHVQLKEEEMVDALLIVMIRNVEMMVVVEVVENVKKENIVAMNSYVRNVMIGFVVNGCYVQMGSKKEYVQVNCVVIQEQKQENVV